MIMISKDNDDFKWWKMNEYKRSDHLFGLKTYEEATLGNPGLLTALLLFNDTFKEITGKDFDLLNHTVKKLSFFEMYKDIWSKKCIYSDEYLKETMIFIDIKFKNRRVIVNEHLNKVGFIIVNKNTSNQVVGCGLWGLKDGNPDLERPGSTAFFKRQLHEGMTFKN